MFKDQTNYHSLKFLNFQNNFVLKIFVNNFRQFLLAEVEIQERVEVEEEETEEVPEESTENNEKRLYHGFQGPLTEIEENNLPLNVSSADSLIKIQRLYPILLILLHVI